MGPPGYYWVAMLSIVAVNPYWHSLGLDGKSNLNLGQQSHLALPALTQRQSSAT